MRKRIVLVFATIALVTAAVIVFRRHSTPTVTPQAPQAPQAPRQAVRFYLKLSDAAWGTPAERDRLMAFDEQLATRFQTKDPFEYDGHEVGEGFFTMYFYGPSADTIISTMRPMLSEFGIPPGSYFIRRNGDIGTPEQRFPL